MNYLVDGIEINVVLKYVVECGVNVVGLNCYYGLYYM